MEVLTADILVDEDGTWRLNIVAFVEEKLAYEGYRLMLRGDIPDITRGYDFEGEE